VYDVHMDAAGTPLDLTFTEPLTDNMGPNAWTVVILPGSAALLGSAKPVKVAGTIDGNEFSSTVLPLGEGTHMLAVNAKLKKLVSKGAGETVSVHLSRQF
jgi:hypothetical protein